MEVVKTLKKDVFGSVELVKLEDEQLAVHRNYGSAKIFFRPIAFYLAYREKKILEALESLKEDRLSRLIRFGKGSLLRSYLEGESLSESQIQDSQFYEEAKELLKKMHSCGVVHNDSEKPENWLVMKDNRPGIIDFQLSLRFPWKGFLYRICVKEDFRHLIKQKARFSPDSLTEEEKQVLKKKSFFARMWARFYKPVYRFVTRKIFHFSDRENSEVSR